MSFDPRGRAIVRGVPLLVYLYGPPATGKLTIAEKLRDLTGFRLFHYHLTINAVREVFELGSPPFVEVLHRIRLDVFGTATRAGVSLIFTNNSAWDGPGGRQRFAGLGIGVFCSASRRDGRGCEWIAPRGT